MVATYGPEQRALLESAGVELFERVLAEDGIAVDDERIAEDGPDRAAFDLLVELGLLLLDPDAGTWLPEDPATAQSRVVSPLTSESVRLLQESGDWARAFGSVTATWRRAPRSDARGPFTYLRDEAIGKFLAGVVAEVETEILTAQPQAGRDAQTLAAAAVRDVAAWNAASRSARSTSTPRDAPRSRTSTSPRSPPGARRCARSMSSSIG